MNNINRLFAGVGMVVITWFCLVGLVDFVVRVVLPNYWDLSTFLFGK